jgi:hypothetical protein
MAEIKIVGNISATENISRYKSSDKRLVQQQKLSNEFGKIDDYIELHISDAGGNPLISNYDYKSFKLPTTAVGGDTGDLKYIEIDPIASLQGYGYSTGEFLVQFNFFRNRISNSNDRALFIKEISSDRTEIRVASIFLSNSEIELKALELINEINSTSYYKDYLLDFDNNRQEVVVNIALNRNPNGYEILFKLYEPLPTSIVEKDQFWVVDEIIDPYIFTIDLDKLIIPDPLPQLRGPNFDIRIKEQNNLSTDYQSYDDVISTYQTTTSSSYYQLLSFTTSQSVDINIDYTNYNNFSKFGSVEQRINNFFYKVSQIEDYNNFITNQSANAATTSSLALEISNISSSVANIIANFDGYEYYLYFESSSYTYPKSTSTKPFLLYSTGSSQVQTWMTASLVSASNYDSNNQDYLVYAIPGYVRNDSDNQPYLTFTNMVGHYFDNIWIYLKSITDLYKSENNLSEGVSKDLVYYALKGIGVKLYNSKGNDDLTNYIVGNNSGSISDYTNLGNEFLNNIPRQDLLAETFKRIYHNVSLLFKSKGTVIGLDTVNNIFGVTGSILNIKEFGGLKPSEYLKGYTTDKVRIIDNTITGSVLSPYVSVQQVATSSSEIRSVDIHRLDVSFSPQNQIDTVISASILANYPTFNIDDYLGDPRQEYSSSYNDLNVTASLVFSSSFTDMFDYAGFVRLIKFFDNSLFKTLKDYSPARSNITTGVTIRSHQLERIKIAKARPDIVSESVYDIDLDTVDISEDNNYLYNNLTGSKAPFYTGEITGSEHDIHQYFQKTNSNPYISNKTGSFILAGFPSTTGSFNFDDSNLFNHTDFNVAYGNVTGSRYDGHRRLLDPKPRTHPIFLLTSSADPGFPIAYDGLYGYLDLDGNEIDATLAPLSSVVLYNALSVLYASTGGGFINVSVIGTGSYFAPSDLDITSEEIDIDLQGHINSRYNGSKVTSVEYNNYTSASSNYDGDKSYGKTAAIDKQVLKIGLFSEVGENKYLSKRNNVALKYLVDKDGSLTELNQRNKHWEEVQNTFIVGDNLVISLFDSQKYSNQKTTDGEKLIFNSGYSYFPMLYWETDSTLYFQYNGTSIAKLFKAKNLKADNYVNGGGVPSYPLTASGSKKVVYEIFENDSDLSQGTFDDSDLYTPGSSGSTSYPKYTVPEAGSYVFSANFDLTIEFGSSQQSGSYSFQILKNGTIIKEQILPFSSSLVMSNDIGSTYFSLDNPNSFPSSTGFSVTSETTIDNIVYLDQNGITQILPAGSTLYRGNGYLNFPYCPLGSNTGAPQADFASVPTHSLLTLVDPLSNYTTGILNCNYSTNSITTFKKFNGQMFSNTGSLFGTTKTFNLQSNIDDYLSGDIVQFRFIENGISTSNYTASLSSGLLQVQLQSTFNNTSPYATSSAAPFISGSISPSTLVLNQSLSGFIGYIFLPDGSASGSLSSSLYSTYGDVDYEFVPEGGDYMVMTYHGATSEFQISSYQLSGSKALLNISPALPTALTTAFQPQDVEKVLFLKRIKDEQNVILKFQKREGQTSYGLIIPDNIHPDVLNNIDTITSEIKTKLIENGLVSGSF